MFDGSEKGRSVFYDKSHIDIVKNGIVAVTDVLSNASMAEKESLLLCLDWYLDPWFGHQPPYIEQLAVLLQQVIIDPFNTKAVKEDALNLLTSYMWPPFAVLETNLDKIDSALAADVQYAINLDKEN